MIFRLPIAYCWTCGYLFIVFPKWLGDVEDKLRCQKCRPTSQFYPSELLEWMLL